MRSIAVCAGLAGLFAVGCASSRYHAKAEVHEERAEHAWDTGHPVKATKEKVKEEKDRAEEHHHD